MNDHTKDLQNKFNKILINANKNCSDHSLFSWIFFLMQQEKLSWKKIMKNYYYYQIFF